MDAIVAQLVAQEGILEFLEKKVAPQLNLLDPKSLLEIAQTNVPAIADLLCVRVVGNLHRRLKADAEAKREILLSPKQQQLMKDAGYVPSLSLSFKIPFA